MTTFIYIDSSLRNAEDISPSSFKIPSAATKSWIMQPRSVALVPPSLNNQGLDYKSTLTCDEFIVEYTWPTATPGVIAPLVKINFYNLEYNEPQMVNSMYDSDIFTKFIATKHKILSTTTSGANTITWISYRSKMVQVLRIKRVGDFYLTVVDENSTALNCTRVVGVFGILPVLVSPKYHTLDVQYRS